LLPTFVLLSQRTTENSDSECLLIPPGRITLSAKRESTPDQCADLKRDRPREPRPVIGIWWIRSHPEAPTPTGRSYRPRSAVKND